MFSVFWTVCAAAIPLLPRRLVLRFDSLSDGYSPWDFEYE
jgi:hypothetical protein